MAFCIFCIFLGPSGRCSGSSRQSPSSTRSRRQTAPPSSVGTYAIPYRYLQTPRGPVSCPSPPKGTCPIRHFGPLSGSPPLEMLSSVNCSNRFEGKPRKPRFDWYFTLFFVFINSNQNESDPMGETHILV